MLVERMRVLMRIGSTAEELSSRGRRSAETNPGLPAAAEAVDFRAAMRQAAASVTIVTSGTGVHQRGITATAVCSLSAAPPALIVCINKDSECHDTVRICGVFAVNILAPEHEWLAHQFAGRHKLRGAARFRDEEWTELSTGAPGLRGAIAVLDCVLREALDGGTHSIFVGHVVAAQSDVNRAGLLYRSGAFVALGIKPIA